MEPEIIKELVPRTARLVLYVLVALAALVFGAWQAADGDWVTFAGSLIVALQGVMSATYVPRTEHGDVAAAPGGNGGV